MEMLLRDLWCLFGLQLQSQLGEILGIFFVDILYYNAFQAPKEISV